jgi:Putative zinc-finger
MHTCLDEGLLQAYMDGELAGAQLETVSAHLAACATCAELAHEAEHEYALVSTAFAPVLTTPAPTERLRARLDDAIADLHAPARYPAETANSRLRAWWAALAASFNFTPRQVGAFASFILAVALTVALTMLRPQPPGPPQVAQGGQSNPTTRINPTADVQTRQSGAPASENSAVQKVKASEQPTQIVNVKHVQRAPKPGANRPASEQPAQQPQTAGLLPDEKNYMTTIATLDAAIKAQAQQGLSPTLRAEYERNLAVVDQAIIATRVAARRNPQDENAKQFLRTAYQNKVDLLTTVADQTQFIAARD